MAMTVMMLTMRMVRMMMTTGRSPHPRPSRIATVTPRVRQFLRQLLRR
jgi:hypothetical protein